MKLVVVGAGIIGLAAARQAQIADPELEVVVLEKEDGVALHQTGRNSGVVHAGIYYPEGSLKAKLCRRGVGLLKDFAAEHGVAYEECGKLVVATNDEEAESLVSLFERASANGVPGLKLLSAGEAREVEAHVSAVAALHSPSTAIVDYPAVAEAIAEEVKVRGGRVITGREVAAVESSAGRPSVVLVDGTIERCDRVLVCAGLHSDLLAARSGEHSSPQILPFRGEYWALAPTRRHLVNGLIYPVPDPSLPFLGVHLTRCVNGEVLVGPNAVLATAREGYRRRDFSAAELRREVSSPALWRLARKYPRVALSEIGRSLSRRRFVAEARRYVPELRSQDVVPYASGVRAQAVDRDGTLVDDFRLEDTGNVVWVRNAPSPGATSCLAIAETLVERLGLD